MVWSDSGPKLRIESVGGALCQLCGTDYHLCCDSIQRYEVLRLPQFLECSHLQQVEEAQCIVWDML